MVYRRKYNKKDEKPFIVEQLRKMIEDNEPLAIPGIVFQELLSGLKTLSQF